MPYLRTTLLMLTFATAMPAFGHDVVSKLSPQWCMDPKTVPVVVSKFTYTEGQLITMSTQNASGASTQRQYGQQQQTDDNGTCGIVDDPWFKATNIALDTCEAVSKGPQAQAMPMIDNTSRYNVEDHHEAYRFSQGLSGVCVVCVPESQAPR